MLLSHGLPQSKKYNQWQDIQSACTYIKWIQRMSFLFITAHEAWRVFIEDEKSHSLASEMPRGEMTYVQMTQSTYFSCSEFTYPIWDQRKPSVTILSALDEKSFGLQG